MCTNSYSKKFIFEKLAENISSSTHFWKELKKISPANKVTTNVMDNAHGDKNVMELLLTKYKTLYNSVPTTFELYY